jgi:small subunit ribosomal protein S4
MPHRGPKAKLSRALSLALTPKAARVMERRPFSPGQHGQNRRRNASVYKTQLVEKQRLKFTYNISEAQLEKAYEKATRKHGSTGEILMSLLETRLDAAVFRMGFARTIFAARQYVAHGHFEVNGVRCFTPSIQLRVGDEIKLREKSHNHVQIIESLDNKATAPEYFEVDAGKKLGKYVAAPLREQIPVNLNEQLVVEYYSR